MSSPTRRPARYCSLKVRAADSLRWLKNGVELKECADGGLSPACTHRLYASEDYAERH